MVGRNHMLSDKWLMLGLLFICLNAISSYEAIIKKVCRWKQTCPYGECREYVSLCFECRQLQFKVLQAEVVNR